MVHEIRESFLAQNNKDLVNNRDILKVYGIVHEQAKKVESDILGITIGDAKGFGMGKKGTDIQTYENFQLLTAKKCIGAPKQLTGK